MATTVEDLIHRLYRTYLEPPDDQPARCTLNISATASDTEMTLSSFAVPEDSQLLRLQSLIEVESELCRVTSLTETPAQITVTVTRGVDGTTAVAHAAGSSVVLAPTFTRLSTFEAVADNITTLYPRLYTVKVVQTSGGRGVLPLEDDLAVQIVKVWPDGWADQSIDGKIEDYRQEVGGRAVVLSHNGLGGSFWVRYRRRMGKATSLDNELDDLGVDDRWVGIVMAGAAADLMVGRDISQSHVNWVGKALETESIPVGTRTDLAVTLARYRDLLLERFAKEMAAEYKPRIRVRNTFKSQVS